jgi:hypothetical protein
MRQTIFQFSSNLQITKIELQTALGEVTQTDKRTAGVFLDTLSPTSDGVLAFGTCLGRPGRE